jgi:hypothetical protein
MGVGLGRRSKTVLDSKRMTLIEGRVTRISECPNCSTPQDDYGWSTCGGCGSPLAQCHYCKCLFVRAWQRDPGGLTTSIYCGACRSRQQLYTHVRKSSLYEFSPYAFKLVNAESIWNPTAYFETSFPIGRVITERYQFKDDFTHEETPESRWWNLFSRRSGTTSGADAGAYALVVGTQMDVEQNPIDLLVVTHKTGLEVFIPRAALFVDAEVSKFILKRTLEKVEKDINFWWEQWRARPDAGAERSASSRKPLVGHIVIRTQHWEISLDRGFSRSQREQIIAHVAATTTTAGTIEEFVATIESNKLKRKVCSRSRRVVRRQIAE